MSCCDEAAAQGFADCEALVVAEAQRLAARLDSGELVSGLFAVHDAEAEAVAAWTLRQFALAVSLGQCRSEANDLAVLSAHRTAVNRAQAQAAGRASAAKRWGPKGAKS